MSHVLPWRSLMPCQCRYHHNSPVYDYTEPLVQLLLILSAAIVWAALFYKPRLLERRSEAYIIDNDRPLVRERCKVGVPMVNELYDSFMDRSGIQHLECFLQ